MIEKRYESDPFDRGVEELNTFRQYDEWESQFSIAGKNPFIFDFSHSQWRNLFSTLTAQGAQRKEDHLGLPGRAVWFYDEFGKRDETEPFNEFVETTNDVIGEIAPIIRNSSLGIIDSDYRISSGATIFATPQPASRLDVFRSGYFEFTVKTEKRNCVIFSGSREIELFSTRDLGNTDFDSLVIRPNRRDFYRPSDSETAAGNELPQMLDDPNRFAGRNDNGSSNIEIGLMDGKIYVQYFDKYSELNNDFFILGDQRIDDNQWHHVVVNFGRPGLKKDHSEKFNQRFIDIWVDAKLEKRFDDVVNESNIFYPTIKYIGNSPSRLFPPGSDLNLVSALSQDKNKELAFVGSIHTISHGLFIPISKFEINKRFNLWKRIDRPALEPKPVTAESSMLGASTSTNKKKALKLFWNNLDTVGKFGVELDDNFQVDSYSVTHRTKNSKTELYNFDVKEQREVSFFENVKVVFTESVLTQGPARTTMWNERSHSFNNLDIPTVRTPNTRNPAEAKINTTDQQQSASVVSNPFTFSANTIFTGIRADLSFSGIKLDRGDRILLTNQIIESENGIWIYQGESDYLVRDSENLLGEKDKTNIVYVEEGFYKDSYWKLEEFVDDISKPQKWSFISSNDSNYLTVAPELSTRWKNSFGEDRFINILDDVDLSDYDVLVFMNYPESNEEIFESFPNESDFNIMKMYKDFVNQIVVAASNGLSVFVSSPRLAEDMGIVKKYSQVSQLFEDDDQISANINPFEVGESSERYFDTHRNNLYHISTEVPGLTNKQTWQMTNFISYIPEEEYENEEWHIKYSFRPTGLKENDEFYAHGFALRPYSEINSLPGYRNNYRGKDFMYAVAPQDVLAGTVVTQPGTCCYLEGGLSANPYNQYATTIVVHDGQLLGGVPINGKIFVNCTEDSYTYSREEYNKSVIQVIPQDAIGETAAKRAWQYSTSRLDRKKKIFEVSSVDSYGQTTPTLGGGGPLVQGTSNSSNGIIRSETDRNNPNFQSDFYPTKEEERFELQEIPTYSMTWLGLKWLIGE